MANLSNAFGTIKVEAVGQELLDFLNAVQGEENQAYYKLVEIDQLCDKPDKDGNLVINFSTFGRWNYSNNIKGYLLGDWMSGEEDSTAYSKFIEAMKEKNGQIEIDYQDSDPANDWMGHGVYTIKFVNGELVEGEEWDEESVSIKRYAEVNGLSDEEAMNYIYGDEVVGKYQDYESECEAKGITPKDPDTWYEEDFEWE